jgi:glycosyltransferase involved in cell wall biosynthesis
MNILIRCPEQATGIEYYRQLQPHDYMSRDENYKMFRTPSIFGMKKEELETMEIVQYARHIEGTTDRAKQAFTQLRKQGTKIVFDIDDYWHVPTHHRMYRTYKDGMTDHVYWCIKNADVVTTTTEFLADKIKPYNKNVYVIPNALEYNVGQWNIRKIDSPRVRFGWVGGVYHDRDLEILRHHIKDIYNEVDNKLFQFCVAGFNIHEGVINPFYLKLEEMFSDGYNVNKNYAEYLKLFSNFAEHYGFNQPYRRIWSLPVEQYGQIYNELDVALIPLEDNTFNSCKSQLKLIEAGMMKKSALVSNVAPYNAESFPVPFLGDDDWTDAIKYMVNNRSLREDTADALHEYVINNYSLSKVNELRKQLYDSLI